MMRRELLDFRGESGHRAREEPAVGEEDVQSQRVSNQSRRR